MRTRKIRILEVKKQKVRARGFEERVELDKKEQSSSLRSALKKPGLSLTFVLSPSSAPAMPPPCHSGRSVMALAASGPVPSF
jgi:hypothetical protein